MKITAAPPVLTPSPARSTLTPAQAGQLDGWTASRADDLQQAKELRATAASLQSAASGLGKLKLVTLAMSAAGAAATGCAVAAGHPWLALAGGTFTAMPVMQFHSLSKQIDHNENLAMLKLDRADRLLAGSTLSDVASPTGSGSGKDYGGNVSLD